MENGPIEDVFPIEHGDIPASYVSLPEGNFRPKIKGKQQLMRLMGRPDHFFGELVAHLN